ncbi:PAS domain-containing protein [Ferrovibrio terrae]|uniref:PAS domain-containing protein n=1 Tax=Ferrovibrio terrae TaxID=2594003 RepID=A0A516H633_9PROT|nr:PAS domain-containing protein [Ferrovibrio terrae]QDO99228.1 PAS domain-containing protein [Ferrovibrio terrae]
MNIEPHFLSRFLRLGPGPHHAANAPAISNPRLQRLYELWDTKRGGSLVAPARSDFSIAEFKPWLGNLLILDNIGAREDIRFRLYGTNLAELFGFDLTYKTVLESTLLIGDRPLVEYQEVSQQQRPIHVSRFTPTARRHIAVDKLALPLMSHDRVDQILAAIYPSEPDEI